MLWDTTEPSQTTLHLPYWSARPGRPIEDRMITISWMEETVQSHCVGELGHYVLLGDQGSSTSDLDEAGTIRISGMDSSLRLALFNHENGADVYIMLLRPTDDSIEISDDSVGNNSTVVRLAPTVDDDEWVTLQYGEAVRWDPESTLYLGSSHSATLSLGDYTGITPQALLRGCQSLGISSVADDESADSRSATAFNTEINRKVSAASSDCQSSIGNSSPRSRKGRKRRPSTCKVLPLESRILPPSFRKYQRCSSGVSFYDISDPPEDTSPPLKQPRRASVVQFDSEPHPI